MERAHEQGRTVVSFRPSGAGRYFSAAFLLAWLCGWAIGEAFALLAVASILGATLAPDLLREWGAPAFGAPGAGWFMVLFLAFWLTLWTLGGLAAGHELLRLLWSEDRIEFDRASLRLQARVGPFRRRREWGAAEVRRVSLGHRDGALVLHARRAAHTLTRWGTPGERQSVRDEIASLLEASSAGAAVAELPEGWSSEPSAEGGWLLFRDRAPRRAAARVAWSLTLGLALLAACANARPFLSGDWGAGDLAAALSAGFVLALLAAGSAWLSHGGDELLVRPGWIEARWRYLGHRSTRTFTSPRLRVTRRSDSDGDEWFELRIEGDDRRHTVVRAMNESDAVLGLAHWLAGRGAATLEIERGIEPADAAARAG